MAVSFQKQREQMLEQHIARRGICHPRILQAMGEVPREKFVPPELTASAYKDMPLPIGEEQTISQPFIVAYMLEALKLPSQSRVLEIGTGSGYAAAVLSRIARKVYTVERHASLAEAAHRRFEKLGYDNIEVLCGDGSKGWPQHAPYNGILVSAAAANIPQALSEQLSDGGHMVIPTGAAGRDQRLVRINRTRDSFSKKHLTDVRFVPLIEDPQDP